MTELGFDRWGTVAPAWRKADVDGRDDWIARA